MPVAEADLIGAGLSAVPCICGIVLGLLHNRFWRSIPLLCAAASIIFTTLWIPTTSSFGAILQVVIFGVIWLLIGYIIGGAQRVYLEEAGYLRFVFLISSTAVSISLGQLLWEAINWRILGHSTGAEFYSAVYRWAPLAGVGFLFFVPLVKMFDPMVRYSDLLRGMLPLLGFWGFFQFVIEQLGSNLVMSWVWWVPDVPAPEGYDVLFEGTVGLFSAYRIFQRTWKAAADPGEQDQENGSKKDTLLGVMVEMARVSGDPSIFGRVSHPLENPVLPKIRKPPRWKEFDWQCEETYCWKQLLPPGMRRDTALDLYVYAYWNPEAPTWELLRLNVMSNLQARDAHVKRRRPEKLPNKYEWGQPYECWYEEKGQLSLPKNVYVATFVVEKCEYVLFWGSMYPEIYERYLPVAEALVRDLEF